ncbi:hypothetical protein HDU85_001253 [Gaertneriomyces sp. JEL0708]|nr:hypothetical protein HDU85_001253 [Gaertneriomyces sp. JEL0708]
MNWIDDIKAMVQSAAPKGLDHCFTSMCGSCANENAIKTAFMWYRNRQRTGSGALDFTEEDLTSCLQNSAPGSPDIGVLSFRNGFHGRLMGTLSMTRTKPIHKLDIPAFKWPQADFPKLRYPLEEYARENATEERRCLAQVEDLIARGQKRKENGGDAVEIAAVIVEPVQGEGGDNHATPKFFQGLRDITKRYGVAMVVDEVQTGVGASGKFWAHEHWNLSEAPDFVTFSKKMQASGFYFSKEMRPSQPFRNFGTWMGDYVRLMQAKHIIEEIHSNDLLDLVEDTGNYIMEGLTDIAATGRGAAIQDVRGVGSFIAFNLPNQQARDALVAKMRNYGVNVGGCGERAIRLRPMLVLTQQHADIFLDTIEVALD